MLTRQKALAYTHCLMDDSLIKLQQQAIDAALSSKWDEAIQINQRIIDQDPNSVDTLNRIGRAYFELGNFVSARAYYQKTLKMDPYNQIAPKFLKKIEAFSKKGFKMESHISPPISSDLFIEEPGKTKVVTLLKTAEPQKLSRLSAGSVVKLVVKNRGVCVTDQNEEYLGVLPDDLGFHLSKMIRGGNKYQALVKTIKLNGLSILIREVYRSPRFKNQPSFLDSINMAFTYSSDHLIIPDETYDESLNSYDDDSA